MGQNFIGEIKMVAINFAPKDWAYCDGQVMPISQNATLYSLLATQFGGNGTTNFQLPDLRGRSPMHHGNTLEQGQFGGYEQVTITSLTMPMHTHTFTATSDDATSNRVDPPNTNVMAVASLVGGTPANIYRNVDPSNMTQLHPSTCDSVGQNGAHNNLQPSLVIGFCIALQGLYPSRN